MSPAPTTKTQMPAVETTPTRPPAGSYGGPVETTAEVISEPSRHFWLAILGLAVMLGLFSISQHWVPNKWLFGDGAFYLNVVNGILDHGSLRQEGLHPHSWYDQDLGWNRNIDAAWSNIALGRNGEWWPKHPFLMPLCATPFVWAFGPLGSLIFQFLFYVLMAVFAYRIASHVASRPAAAVATAAFVATPWVFDRVWGFNNDVFYTALILIAFDAAIGRRPTLAGVLLGIGVFAKATNVLYGPALLALFLLRKDWRGAMRFCTAAAAPATLYLLVNWYMFGSPFRTGYDRVLVRVAGVKGLHSCVDDFNFRAIWPGIQRVLTSREGFLGRYPLLFPALAGLPLLALRRWREALAIAWCIAVPIAFHAPFTWYRLEFNLPQVALSVAPLAAILPPFARPGTETGPSSRVRWGRLLAVLGVLILIGTGLVRRATAEDREYFWEHLPQAQVFLGEVPCDYYNNQMERWECSSFDSNDWFMTGRPLQPDLYFKGRKEQVLLLHPHPSGKERRLEYPEVPMRAKLKIRYGLADLSRSDARVHLKVLIDGEVVHETDVEGRGLTVRTLDTARHIGRRAKVSFVVTAEDANWCIFGIDGSPTGE